MHIGLFTDCYSPQVNGVVTSVQILEEELRNLGHQVTVVTVKVPGYEDVHDHVLRIPSIPFMRWSEFRLGIPIYNETYRKIKKLGLDIIHTHTEFTVGHIGKHMATLMDIPIVHTYHTMYEDYSHYVVDRKYGKKVVKKIITASSKYYIKSYDSVIAPTLKTEEALRTYGVRNKINIVPTGIDIKKFEHHLGSEEKMDFRHNYGIAEGDYLMLSLGRVSREKSVDVIIRQMPRLLAFIPKAKLLVVGDGPYRETLELMVKELKLTDCVVFAGQVPFEEVGGFYSVADIFVNASQSETQGLTIIEAMASNLPVVVYDDLNVEGIVMEGSTGRLFKQEVALGDQVMDAYNNKGATEMMTADAYIVVQNLSKEKFAEKVLSVYNKLLQTSYVSVM